MIMGVIKLKIIKNYKSMLILLLAIILGGLFGVLLGEDARVISPFGDLFLNMLLVLVVPLIFLTITSSIYKMHQPKRMGKILVVTFLVFLGTSVIASGVGMVSTLVTPLVHHDDAQVIRDSLEYFDDVSLEQDVELNLLERMVATISTDDFGKLFSRDQMIALIVFAILVGLAMCMSGSKAEPFFNFIESALDILMNLIKIIMYYAPIGLGCYFAALVGTFGKEIAMGYLKTFVLYLVVAVLFYIIVYTLYAYFGGGFSLVKRFWKHVIPATVTSLATCSSAASMAVNIQGTKDMGVSEDIAQTTVSLGTSFHKDGSVIGSVFKIMFLVYLFNDFGNISLLKIMGISLIATLLVTAVPVGGGTISEMLIITLLGYPITALPILTIIATIIDPPATVLNVVGDSASALIINKIVER